MAIQQKVKIITGEMNSKVSKKKTRFGNNNGQTRVWNKKWKWKINNRILPELKYDDRRDGVSAQNGT